MSGFSLRFERVESNLLRYRKTGTYYVEAKVHGSKIRASLNTDKLPDARKKLAAWMNRVRGGSIRAKTSGYLPALVEDDKAWIKTRRIQPKTVTTRLSNLKVIEATWPNYQTTKISSVTRFDVDTWNHAITTKYISKRTGRPYSVAQANQCLCTLRQMFEMAEGKGLLLNPNPADKVKQHAYIRKEPKLPTAAQFQMLRTRIYSNSPAGGELFDFLALCGSRVNASRFVTWGDIDWKNNEITFVKGKKHQYTAPMTTSFREFLVKIRPPHAKPTDRVTRVDNIKKVMNTSCRNLCIPRMTHHTLRHWFVTTVLEKNIVNPETLARWIGHRDGGQLLQKWYGHLRDEHSQRLAKLI